MTSNALSTIIEEGAQLGDLKLIRQIGRGAQGVVYEALQVSMGRRVAAKILPRETTISEEQTERFRREAAAAGRLNHPNVVSVFGFEEIDGHMILIQELVTGGSLQGELLSRESESRTQGPDHIAWCLDVVRQIAWGLDHAHGHDVIHRDIKPGNILMATDGTPKIADFGLAKVEGELGLSMTGAVMGTPHYMSPEQVTGRSGEIDARTDVYSLGALLYRMVTGVVPLDGESRQGLFIDILTRAPKAPRARVPSLAVDVDAVCLKSLEKSSDDRYQTARAFAEDLERTRLGESTVARPIGPTQRAWRMVGRLATLSLVLFAMVVALVWWLVDFMTLRGWAAVDPARHDVRMVVVGLATLLLAVPLAVLAVRLGRGRGWLRYVGATGALLVGAAASWVVYQQKLDGQQADARETLMAAVEQQRELPSFIVENLDAIDHLVEEWSWRFSDEDRFLIARAFLVAERPVRAQYWLREAEAEADGDVSPVGHALASAIADALGDEETMVEQAARLATALEESGDARLYLLAGDVFKDVGRYSEARVLYLAGGRVDTTYVSQIELALADLAVRTCRYDDAQDHLEQYTNWNAEDYRSIRLAMKVQTARGQFSEAAESLRRIKRLAPLSDSVMVLELERSTFAETDADARIERSVAHYEKARRDHPENMFVLAWCARAHLIDAAAVEALARQAQMAGDNELALKRSAFALNHLERSKTLYGTLAAREPDLATASVGLASAELKIARYKAGADRELAEQAALDHARRSVSLDPEDVHGHYALYLASKAEQYRVHGVRSASNLPVESILSYVPHLDAAIACSGFEPNPLNDAAYTLSYVYRKTGDAAVLEKARDYSKRAVRLVDDEARGVSCRHSSSTERSISSSIFDTAREVAELAEDDAQALEYAQRAVSALNPGDSAYSRRVDTYQRLKD